MAKLFVSEYRGQARDVVGNPVPTGDEPALAEQTVTFTATGSVQSAAFNQLTTFVRIHADTACYIKFGASPTASGNTKKMAANSTEWFGIGQSGLKVAAIG